MEDPGVFVTMPTMGSTATVGWLLFVRHLLSVDASPDRWGALFAAQAPAQTHSRTNLLAQMKPSACLSAYLLSWHYIALVSCIAGALRPLAVLSLAYTMVLLCTASTRAVHAIQDCNCIETYAGCQQITLCQYAANTDHS